jgi:hypothetical protein
MPAPRQTTLVALAGALSCASLALVACTYDDETTMSTL